MLEKTKTLYSTYSTLYILLILYYDLEALLVLLNLAAFLYVIQSESSLKKVPKFVYNYKNIEMCVFKIIQICLATVTSPSANEN